MTRATPYKPQGEAGRRGSGTHSQAEQGALLGQSGRRGSGGAIRPLGGQGPGRGLAPEMPQRTSRQNRDTQGPAWRSEAGAAPAPAQTHHLGTADRVEPARDAAPATRPDVVLKLKAWPQNRYSSAQPPGPPAPARSESQQGSLAAPASSPSGPTQPNHPPPKAVICAHLPTRTHVCSSWAESRGGCRPRASDTRALSEHLRRPRPGCGPPRPSALRASLRPWGPGASSGGSKPSQE